MPFLFPLHFTARPFADSGGCLCSQLCLIVQRQHCLWHRQFSSGFWPWLWSDFVRQGEAFLIFNRVYAKFNPFYFLWRVGIDATQNVMTLICVWQQPIAVTTFIAQPLVPFTYNERCLGRFTFVVFGVWKGWIYFILNWLWQKKSLSFQQF